MNLVEGWFAQLTNRRLRRGSFCSLDHLREAITLWADQWNQNPTPFRWTAKTSDILAQLERARTALSNTHDNSVADH